VGYQTAKRMWAPALLLAAGLAQPALARQTAPTTVQSVTVVANAPLAAGGVDADKIAGEVQTLSVPALTRDRQTDVLANLIGSQLASVSLTDEQGSPFQPDFVYRGFEASPISGVPEGIAVYQDGVRLNEAFGDNVNWDLVPVFALQTFTVQSNNPVFGLNTMGGAVTLAMKDGLSFQGLDAELSGGSFGNINGNAKYGARFGDFGLYVGIGGLHDDGFRYQSPTTLRQAYGDLAYQHGPLTLHLSVTAADNTIAAVGPTPVEMLAQDPKAVFTYPQSMHNQMQMVQLRGSYALNSNVTFSASGYYRHYEQHLVDGNTTDVDYCDNDPSRLCLEGDNLSPGDALYDNHGNPVSASVLPDGATPGETDFTHTRTNGFGGTLQAAITAPIAGHANNLTIGATVDHGETDYSAFGELGVLEPNLRVDLVGVIIDQGLSPTASPPIEEPVAVKATNTYTGLYAIDVFDITPRLSWTISGRWNLAQIGLRDQTGDAALNADHSFSRFNPGTGLAYKFSKALVAYAGYSESNRAPTAGELSCADPSSPCLLDAFLVSDPSLKQVVSHDYEVGLRGTIDPGALPGTLTWNISAYRTDSDNDILLLATEINGFGYFQNAGSTRRQGVDLHLGYTDRRWTISAGYSFLDATFQSHEVLASNSPAADDDGLIYVRPGNHLPLDPAHRVTLSVDFAATRAWSIGADLRAQSDQYLVGDESNQEPKLPGFVTVDLRSSYKIGSHVELFAQIENLFDRRYYTYGAFTDLGGLPPNFDLSDPRTYSPSPGRRFAVGARLRFQ
jgi:outer membrane receptor protein involved in Fe transport